MGFGGIHPLQLLIVLVLALLFFGGRGKISAIMGDLAKGVTSFRKGLKEGDEPEEKKSSEPKSIDDGDTINITPNKDKTEV